MKRTAIFALAALLICALAGCAAQNKPPQAPVQSVPEATQQPATQAPNMISEQDAKTAALAHAGVNDTDANFVRVRLDYDDGRAEYEIEFYSGNIEYDYDIDAITGEILSFDSDAEFYDPKADVQASATEAAISKEDARRIAVERAGVSDADVKFFNIDTDFENGRAVYDVEFRVGKTEYSFEIDCSSGDILEYEADND